MEKIDTDIAVIAAGPAGLAAAITAAELGLRVVVFEKSAAVGAAGMRMGRFGGGKRMQMDWQEAMTEERDFRITVNHPRWAVDARLVRDCFWKSGSTIDWLEDMGVAFDRPTKYYPGGFAAWHVAQPEGGGVPGPRSAAAMTQVMLRRAQALGVEVHTGTPAVSIRKEGGKVIGLMAVDSEAVEYEVHAKATIIATGGLGSHPDLRREYTGYAVHKELFSLALPGLISDGVRMAWAAGAGKGPVEVEHVTDAEVSAGGTYGSYLIFEQPRALVVNQLGRRVFNEAELCNNAVAANVIGRSPGRYLFSILDDDMIRHMRENGPDAPSAGMRFNIGKSFGGEIAGMLTDFPSSVFAADSIEELESKLGITEGALQATVKAYNACCEARCDDVFLKDLQYLQPLKGKKLYALRLLCGAYGALGGIKVNRKLEVLTEGWEKLPGFYAAGSDVNAIYNGTYRYLLAGNTLGFAVITGRLAAEYAADYVQSL